MGRTPKPWFWEKRNAYYATVNGTRHRLGASVKQARRQLKHLLAVQYEPIAGESLQTLLDAFLRHSRKSRAHKTVDWYETYLGDFAAFMDEQHGGAKDINPESVKPKHVTAWLNDRGTAERARITAVKAAFRWAFREGWIAKNPLSEMERPPVGRREELVTVEDIKAILRSTPDKNFRNLIRFCWEVGCRPQEAIILQRRHLDLENHRCVIPKEQAKGKKRARIIYLTESAERIVAQAEGEFLLVNTRGAPWTSNAVRCRFRRLEAKIGKRIQLYLLRHAWTTRKLVAGEDSHVVAELAGHADTRMIETTYSKISEHQKFLLDAARRKS